MKQEYFISYVFLNHKPGYNYGQTQLYISETNTELFISDIQKHLAELHDITIKDLIILNIINLNKLIE